MDVKPARFEEIEAKRNAKSEVDHSGANRGANREVGEVRKNSPYRSFQSSLYKYLENMIFFDSL